KENLQVTTKAIDATENEKKAENAKTVAALNEAVRDERSIRNERAELIETRGLAEEQVKQTKLAFGSGLSGGAFTAPGGSVILPQQVDQKAAQQKADDAQRHLDEINDRLKEIDGTPEKAGRLANAQSAVSEKGKAAFEADDRNRKDLESLKLQRTIAVSGTSSNLTVSSLEFQTAQKQAAKKLSDERAALDTERAGLEDKNLRSNQLGGDPAGAARIDEIKKRETAIDAEISQRSTSVPAIKQSTAKDVKEITGQFNDALQGAKSDAASTDKPTSGVKKAGLITDAFGTHLLPSPLTQPGKGTLSRTGYSPVTPAAPEAGGTITKDGAEIKVSSGETVAELKKVSTTLAESSKDIAKATPAITKAAASTATAIGHYHANIVETFNAQGKRIDTLSQQLKELAQAQRAAADRGA
ncbi:MAG: hypothetical protein ABI273_17490, partial [Lacunisphaera sp.]